MGSYEIDSFAHVSSLYSQTDGKTHNNTLLEVGFYTHHCSFTKAALFVENQTYYRYDSLSVLHHIQSLCSISKTVGETLLWLSIILGIPGNVIAIITILTMSQTTSTFYIALLSLSDLIALTSRASYRLLINYQADFTSELCRFMSFLTNYSLAYANWILVFICFEQFITIRFPIKKPDILTIRRAQYSGLVLALVLFPIGLMFNFLTEASDGQCVFNDSWKEFYINGFSQTTTALFYFTPVLLLFLFTIWVLRELKKHSKIRKRLMGNESFSEQHDQDQGGGHTQGQRLGMEGNGNATPTLETGACCFRSSKNYRRDEDDALGRSITIMMIVKWIVYVVLTLPVCIHYLYAQNMNPSNITNVSYAKNILFSNVVFHLHLLSHSVNFYIYFVSAKKFRSQFQWLFVKRGITVCHGHKYGAYSSNSQTTHV